ncbi:MAG: hypothetical protein K9G49_09440 [Taibaiella sp.]|nr:hypothetical protein [Taibaiella sp.]
MNKLVLAFSALTFISFSCNKVAPVPLTKEQIQQRIDSITTIRLQEVDERAQKDLEHRIKIEVKIKADSILQTLLQKQATELAK